MKKLLERLLSLMLLSPLMFAACTPEENGGLNPVFPEPITEVLNLEESGEVSITFSANMDWTISIPTALSEVFMLEFEDQQFTTVSGSAGQYTVKVVCLLPYADLEDHLLEVLMTMGGQESVIATITLPSSEPVFSVKVAEYDMVNDVPYFVEADGTGLSYNYVDLNTDGADGKLPMIWDMSRNGYVSYILVESNCGIVTNIAEIQDLIITPLENSSENSRLTEYELLYKKINLENSSSFSFTANPGITAEGITGATLNYYIESAGLEFMLKVSQINETGDDFALGEDPYNWSYAAPEYPNIPMLWRPQYNPEIMDLYFLISSNFRAKIAPTNPDVTWIKVDEPVIIEEKTNDTMMEAYYHVWVDFSEITDEAALGGEYYLSISVDGTDIVMSSEDFCIFYGISDDMLYVNTVPTFNFKGDGTYEPAEMSTAQEAYVDITCASDLEIKAFVYNSDGWINDHDMISSEGLGWIGYELEYSVNGPAIQTKRLYLNVDQNTTGDAREGIVMAFPTSVYEGLFDLGAEEGYLSMVVFDENNNVVADYAKYVVANISQAAPAGAIEPYMVNEWANAGASFDTLGYDDMLVQNLGIEAYVITHTYEDLDNAPSFGGEISFDINIEYDNAAYYDAELTEIGTDNAWFELAESEYEAGKYTVILTPGTPTAKSGYIVFSNAGEFVAALKIDYQPGGSGASTSFDLTLMSSPDFTITKLEAGDSRIPAGFGTAPCFYLNCTPDGTYTDFTAYIQGLPNYDMVMGGEEWIANSAMGTMYQITVDTTKVTAENKPCYIAFMTSSYSTVAVIVIDVAL